jgi:hypothetical protein
MQCKHEQQANPTRYITKTGNANRRRIAIKAAWSYRCRPGVGPARRKRQEGVAKEIKEIAWKAEHRLHKRLRLSQPHSGEVAAQNQELIIMQTVTRSPLLAELMSRSGHEALRVS